jgi:hypothetical protein
MYKQFVSAAGQQAAAAPEVVRSSPVPITLITGEQQHGSKQQLCLPVSMLPSQLYSIITALAAVQA